jgi:hypothetical protein
MNWLKHVFVDVAVTALIVLAATMDLVWARWIVLIYTPLMLILKIVAFAGSNSLSKIKQKETGVPVWFYHVLYAVNVVVAIVAAMQGMTHWWLIAGGWALIWTLSIAADARMRPATAR